MPELQVPVGNTQPPLPGVLPPGTLLRGYEVKSVLGKGAFGITYRAVDATLDRDVAIKEYLPTTLALREGRTTVLPHSPEHAEQFAWGRERFLDEARTLARLDRTTAIVRVYDFLEANGTAYMVMALIEGETLGKRLMRETRLDAGRGGSPARSLLDGLEELHAASFLHRDIKPANIMVDDQGRPTLIDFGAARAAMVGRSTTMTAVFTPGYAAAEQFVHTLEARSVDRHLWSLGDVLPGHHRAHPAKRHRAHHERYLPIPGRAATGRLPALASRRHRCGARVARSRPAAEHRRMEAGAAAWLHGAGGDPDRPQAWPVCTCGT